MLVDSSALPEQVVDAVVMSAFRSAGQRCSALRLLVVHTAIADGVIAMLQVVRWSTGDTSNPEDVIAPINALGFGLSLGIQTRIDSRALALAAAAHVGNIYVNRNMIGAVVGVQPFGGEGLSGTGPKAGGPHYLYRFCAEQTVTVNTTAAGGNAALLASGH